MPIRVECPAGHKLIIPDDRVGQPLRCPRCEAEAGVGERESVVGKEEAEVKRERSVQSEVRVSECTSEDSPQVAESLLSTEYLVLSASPLDEKLGESLFTGIANPPAAATLPPPPAAPQPLAPGVQSPTDRVANTDLRSTPADSRLPTPDLIAPNHGPPRTLVPPRPITVDPYWRPAANWLSAALVAAGLFAMAPAVWDVAEYVHYLGAVNAPAVARWALMVLLLGVVQLAYAVYLFQLPDWTSVWAVTLYSLAAAGAYAMTLGVVLTADAEDWLVGPQGLQLADKLAGGRAALWCLAMVSVSTILAFFAGRLSVQWRRAELVLRRAGM